MVPVWGCGGLRGGCAAPFGARRGGADSPRAAWGSQWVRGPAAGWLALWGGGAHRPRRCRPSQGPASLRRGLRDEGTGRLREAMEAGHAAFVYRGPRGGRWQKGPSASVRVASWQRRCWRTTRKYCASSSHRVRIQSGGAWGAARAVGGRCKQQPVFTCDPLDVMDFIHKT